MRRRIFGLLVGGLLFVGTAAFAGTPARFMQYPDIHGDAVVFTYEGDLWLVPAAGGQARRITNHPGTEDAAKFSPDGTLIAFSANYDAGSNVYVMPAGGGPPRRVTYYNGRVQAVAWTPDSKRIVFRSGHENTFRPIV